MTKYKPKPSTKEVIDKVKTLNCLSGTVVFGRGLSRIQSDICFARIYNFTKGTPTTMHYIIRSANTDLFDYNSIIKDVNRIFGRITPVRLFETDRENTYVVECSEGLKTKYPNHFLDVYYMCLFVILRCCDYEYTRKYSNEVLEKIDLAGIKLPIKNVETLLHAHYIQKNGQSGHGVSEFISDNYLNERIFKLAIRHHINTLYAAFSRKSKFPRKVVVDSIQDIVANRGYRTKRGGYSSSSYIAQTNSFYIVEQVVMTLSEKYR